MTATDQLATGDLQELAHRHLLMHFTRNGAFGPEGKPLLVLDRGEGVYVFDTDGKRYSAKVDNPNTVARPKDNPAQWLGATSALGRGDWVSTQYYNEGDEVLEAVRTRSKLPDSLGGAGPSASNSRGAAP